MRQFKQLSEIQESLGDDPPVVVALQREMLDPYVLAYFTIEGEPQSKARARWGGARGGTPTYSPQANKEAEQKIAWLFRQAVGPYQPSDNTNFGVFAAFFAGSRQRRDVDNMLKLVCDGLTGVAWVDDAQVTEVSGKVVRGVDDPRTEIIIYFTLVQPRPTARCKQCGQPYPYYKSQQDSRQFCTKECGYEYRRRQNERTCEGCGESFRAGHSRQKYCSVTCKSTALTAELTCYTCGVTYRKPRSQHKAGRTFCSQTCLAAFWRMQRKTAARGVCDDCGGPTSKKQYKRCMACCAAASTGA